MRTEIPNKYRTWKRNYLAIKSQSNWINIYLISQMNKINLSHCAKMRNSRIKMLIHFNKTGHTYSTGTELLHRCLLFVTSKFRGSLSLVGVVSLIDCITVPTVSLLHMLVFIAHTNTFTTDLSSVWCKWCSEWSLVYKSFRIRRRGVWEQPWNQS